MSSPVMWQAFVKPGDVAVRAGLLLLLLVMQWMLGAECSALGLLALIGISDVTMGRCWELGAHPQDRWCSSTLVMWQPVPVLFGVQQTRGEEMGGVTHLGCMQWAVATTVLVDDGWWW